MSPFGQVIPVTGLNFGFPGTVSELGDPLVVSKPVLHGTPSRVAAGDVVVVIPTTGGGDAVVNMADFLLASGSGGQGGTFTAAKFGGVALREVHTQLTFPANPDVSQAMSYGPDEQAEVVVRGTVSVTVKNGTPASQGDVYVRKTLNGTFPNGVIGGFEALVSDSGSNCVKLANVVFKNGNMDGNNVTEITILERSAA